MSRPPAHPLPPPNNTMHVRMAPVSSLIFFLVAACLTHQTCCIGLPRGLESTANLSTLWTSFPAQLYDDLDNNLYYEDMIADPLLIRSVSGNNSLSFVAGFYRAPPYDTILFAVYISSTDYTNPTAVVWSANRDNLIRQNATLNFTSDGDLVLRDADGTLVWSTDTSGQSAVAMTLTESGNLVLFDHNNVTVWQSFDHPTDSLLPEQRLIEGMRLVPNASATNCNSSKQLYLAVRSGALYGYAGSIQPQLYFVYYDIVNGSLEFFPEFSTLAKPTQPFQYVRFESDGHLRLYEWQAPALDWSTRKDILSFQDCSYPTACGEYGICKDGGRCSCPFASNTSTMYFKQIDNWNPSLGCILETTISCQSAQNHQLIAFPGVSYFRYNISNNAVVIDEESCKQACLRNCSCKAAVIHYESSSYGYCLLLSEVLSLVGDHPTSTAYLKVQITRPFPSAKKRNTLGYALGATAALMMFTTVITIIRRMRNREKDGEDDFGELPGMPTRFAFQTLKVATEDFSNKLGEGGFGSVFKGQLDDKIVAVKRLDRADQGKEEFLAEVQTIGSIHHINLVKLIGFCYEKSHRLLVFEYMSRGSLEKWIYYRDNNTPLDWHTRCMVITDVARGLSYLHDDCRQKIAHLDIKPQNILLDDNFNAKVSDFGLSKLIDRDESHVVTRMRGTPGYMAPEWLTSQITEKADVYSFGIVVMEIISGRKNIDFSQPEGSIQLITLLQEKAQSSERL